MLNGNRCRAETRKPTGIGGPSQPTGSSPELAPLSGCQVVSCREYVVPFAQKAFPSLNLGLFLITAVLRNNPYIIQFPHVKCAVQGFLVYSQSCTSPQPVVEHGRHLQKKPTPFSCHPRSPRPPALGTHTSLSVCRFACSGLSCKWNHTQYVTFVTGCFALGICECIRTSFFITKCSVV